MPEYTKFVNKLIKIAAEYKIDIEAQVDTLRYIEEYSATLPVIGAFNTGKSSAINTILGQELLPTSIVPQVCPPVEVTYGNNSLTLHRKNIAQKVDLTYLREKGADLEDVTLAKLCCDNDFFKSIKDITLVDIPGYDSGMQQHERWVRNYLFNSFSYLLIVAADEPVLKYSFIQLLNAYTSHEKPMFLLITKCDKLPEKEVQACKEYLERTIKEFLPVKNIYVILLQEDLMELRRHFIYIANYLVKSKKQMLYSQMLYLSNYVKTVLSNEVLFEDMPLPERHRLLEKQEMQFKNLVETNADITEKLKAAVNDEINNIRQRVNIYVNELVEPIWMLASSGQNTIAFINSIIPAYINKEVYSNIFPLFSSHQKKLNSLLNLYQLNEGYSEPKETDIVTEVLSVVLNGEEAFSADLLPLIEKLNRRVKRQDGETIIKEFILSQIAEAIVIWVRDGLLNYLKEYDNTVQQQINMANNIKDRITKNLQDVANSTGGNRDIYTSELKITLTNVLYIIECCTELKEKDD